MPSIIANTTSKTSHCGLRIKSRNFFVEIFFGRTQYYRRSLRKKLTIYFVFSCLWKNTHNNFVINIFLKINTGQNTDFAFGYTKVLAADPTKSGFSKFYSILSEKMGYEKKKKKTSQISFQFAFGTVDCKSVRLISWN